MNILLFSPALLLLLWKRFGFFATLPKLIICAALQVVLALPFLTAHPYSYFKGAFDFGKGHGIRFPLSFTRFLSLIYVVVFIVFVCSL